MTKEDKLELTDEIYDALSDEYHGKIVVVGIDDDKYVCRYPNKVEYKAIQKYIREGAGKGPLGLSERSLGLVVESVKGLIVWPEPEVFAEREEYDGGLMDSIAIIFLTSYNGRAEEKKR